MEDPQLEEYRQRMRGRGTASSQPQFLPFDPPQVVSAPPPAISSQEVRPLLPQSSRSAQAKGKDSCLPDSSECWGVKSSLCVLALAAVLTSALLISLFLLLFL